VNQQADTDGPMHVHLETLPSTPECGKHEEILVHATPLQPSDDLEEPVDGFIHLMQSQFPPQPPGGPTEPIEVSLAHNSLPLNAFGPGTGT
jgi:hypothetical protein